MCIVSAVTYFCLLKKIIMILTFKGPDKWLFDQDYFPHYIVFKDTSLDLFIPSVDIGGLRRNKQKQNKVLSTQLLSGFHVH